MTPGPNQALLHCTPSHPPAALCLPSLCLHLRPRLLLPVAALLHAGEIANFVAPHTRNVVPSVRCAATSALAAVLLVPGVQAVMGASAGVFTPWL